MLMKKYDILFIFLCSDGMTCIEKRVNATFVRYLAISCNTQIIRWVVVDAIATTNQKQRKKEKR